MIITVSGKQQCISSKAHLQLCCPLLGESLVFIGEGQSVVFCQGAKVKVVLGVGAGRHVDVEL